MHVKFSTLTPQADGDLSSIVCLHQTPALLRGKFSLDISNFPEFTKEYWRAATESGVHLAELPRWNQPLLIDVDLEEEREELAPLYTDADAHSVAAAFALAADELLDLAAPASGVPEYAAPHAPAQPRPPHDRIEFLVLVKAPRWKKPGRVKHGFHLHGGNLWMSKALLGAVARSAREKLANDGAPRLAAGVDDVSGKPWLLYGSAKDEEAKPYEIAADKGFAVVMRRDAYLAVTPVATADILSNLGYYSTEADSPLRALSLRFNEVAPALFTRPAREGVNAGLVENTASEEFLVERRKVCASAQPWRDCPVAAIRVMLDMLSDERADNYKEWKTICMALCNQARTGRAPAEEVCQLFHEFSQRSPKYDRDTVQAAWDAVYKSEYQASTAAQTEADGRLVTLGTLRYLARKDSPLMNLEMIARMYPPAPKPNDADIATAFLRWYPRPILYFNNDWYEFDSNLWRMCIDMDNHFRMQLKFWAEEMSQAAAGEEEAAEEATSASEQLYHQKPRTESPWAKILSKCSNHAPSSALINSLKMMCSCNAGRYQNREFNAKRHLIAFRDCVFDSRIHQVRAGRPADMLSRCLSTEYRRVEDLSEESVAFVDRFWRSLFPDESVREFFLNSVAEIFGGSNRDKYYMVWTGVGNNGKSVCIKLFEMLLDRLCVKMPKNVLIALKMDIGSANPEICRLAGARIVITDEISSSDELNCGQVKLLSGNDSLSARDLYQKADQIKTFEPAFIPVMVCNDTPRLRNPDEAAWKRVRIIPFETRFVENQQEYLAEHGPESMDPVDPAYVFERDDYITDHMRTHLPAFASLLLARFCRNAVARRAATFQRRVPDKVKRGEVDFRLSQNIVRHVLCTHYDLKGGDITLTNTEITQLVNDKRFRKLEGAEIRRLLIEMKNLDGLAWDGVEVHNLKTFN